MIVLIGAVATAIALIVPPFVSRLEALGTNVRSGLEEVTYSVAHDLAGISRAEAHRVVEQGLSDLGQHRSRRDRRRDRGGIAGAFLAVPFATVGAVVLDHMRASRTPDVEMPAPGELIASGSRLPLGRPRGQGT